MKRHTQRSGRPSRVPRKPTDLAEESGARLRASREALKLTATQLAARLGVSRSRLSNWESGTSKVDLEYALTLKAVYGLTLDWIFGGDLSTVKSDLAAEIHAKMSAAEAGGESGESEKPPSELPASPRKMRAVK